MEIRRFVVSPFQANCYVYFNPLQEHRPAVLIDPGDLDLQPVFDFLDEQKLTLQAVYCTHGHIDHVSGVDVVRSRYSVPVYIHRADADTVWKALPQTAKRVYGHEIPSLAAPDGYFKEGDQLDFAGETFTVMETPGHSPGSVLFIGKELVFTGDTLFAGSIGRTDLDFANPLDMQTTLRKLLVLRDEFKLYPGHMGATTMEMERESNPFLLRLQ